MKFFKNQNENVLIVKKKDKGGQRNSPLIWLPKQKCIIVASFRACLGICCKITFGTKVIFSTNQDPCFCAHFASIHWICTGMCIALQTKHTVNSEENGRKRSKKLTSDLATIKYRKGGLLNSGRLDDGVHSDWWPEEEEEE